MLKKNKKNNIVFVKTMITSWLAIEKILGSYTNTVLPRLVRRRTIRLSSFSGGALTERAY